MLITSGNFLLDDGSANVMTMESAIDNATRSLINLGQLSVTCGLFFSLGHSSIVIAVNIAIAISSNVYNRINGVGTVGSIVGTAVSGSFLFIVGLANSIILWKIIKRRRQNKKREQRRRNGEVIEDVTADPKENHMLMMRILGPIVNFVNRPWKMYPVGVLFGFGFDTASSIALLAISALARKGSNGSSIPGSYIVILPLLFTAGMTLVDSADSIIMLYSYTGFPERSLLVFSNDREKRATPREVHVSNIASALDEKEKPSPVQEITAGNIDDPEKTRAEEVVAESTAVERAGVAERDIRIKMNVMSGLSIILTLMSILVAFSISIIEIMGLIGQQCGPCNAAAAADDGQGGGLAGRWWRGWANANSQSGFIGVAIVGAFLLIVVGWYGSRWVARKFGRRDDQLQ
ncbi:high-affinity nickel-transport protein-domain-containing protein [Gymnopilus junonius]|uniref:Nickel/cobalt efflux system n=1 Tax=Gymnopilus junonius TaxID=109634 RepID=A0A9P5TKT9_GYMJU|nr:high-affinity nickel-transport protein-domain-containing protein [Gymnopilus junonius]